MDLGGTIKQCRKIKKQTQSELAESAGMSVSHLSLVERNKREPSVSALESIADSLGIPLSVLIFIAAEKEEVAELNPEHIEQLSRNIMELMSNDHK